MAQKKEINLIFYFFSTLLFSLGASAQSQSLGPVNINLPAGWGCESQEQNFICLDQSPSSQKNTAIVISFKKRTPEDALVVYRDQLSRSRTLYQGDLAVPSQPKGLTDRTINEIIWVEGIHLGSEVPDYYTHYYATVAGPYAVLISLSIEKSAYQEMLGLLTPSINSIRLSVAQTPSDLQSQSSANNNRPGQSFNSDSTNNRINILGHSIPRNYAFIGGGFILVLIFLGYALITD